MAFAASARGCLVGAPTLLAVALLCGCAGMAATTSSTRSTPTVPPAAVTPEAGTGLPPGDEVRRDPPPARVATPAAEPAGAAPRCGLDVHRLLRDELALRPGAAERDLYVLLHDALMGPSPGAQPTALRAALEQDLASAGPPRADAPFVEDLDEVRGTVRVELRRWRFVRGGAELLARLVEATAAAMDGGDRERLEACLAVAAELLPSLGRDPARLRALDRELRAQGYPAILHGDEYLRRHEPRYRVVLRRLLPPWVTAPPPTTG